MTKIRTFGLFAHVDAGKTTVTEALLHQAGAIRTPGRVDAGTAHTDTMDVERKRGISVKTCVVRFFKDDVVYHLLDTPGHPDFSYEIEAALRVIEGAVVIVSAVEGVQPHTSIILDEIKRTRIPTLFFINKMDRTGASLDRTVKQLRDEFDPALIVMQGICNELSTKVRTYEALSGLSYLEDALEVMSEYEPSFMERYLTDGFENMESFKQSIASHAKKGRIYPVYAGAALHDVGIKPLLQAIAWALPHSDAHEKDAFSARAFAVENRVLGRAVTLKIDSGHLTVKQKIVTGCGRTVSADRLVVFDGRKEQQIESAQAGEMVTVFGLDGVQKNECLGASIMKTRDVQLAGPVMRVNIHPVEPDQDRALKMALEDLDDEEPRLQLLAARNRKWQVDVYGNIHMEILQTVCLERFGLKIAFGEPFVIYKETPAKQAIGFTSYTMPKPCWAVIKFLIKPAKRGAGFSFFSRVSHDVLPLRYQKQIEEALPKALEQGLYGWQVDDVIIELIDGEHHNIHTKSPDFTVATPMALMEGLKEAQTVLLEPILSFQATGPSSSLGSFLTRIGELRGAFEPPIVVDERFEVKGTIPVAGTMDFAAEYAMRTHGEGRWATRFLMWRPCPIELGAVLERRGVNPLDRAKYILHVRNAL